MAIERRSKNTIDDADQLERYKLLVESVQDYAIFLLDTEGNIASWNPGAEKFKGYKPHEIIGKHFSVFYTDEDKANDKPGYELEYSKKNGRIEDEGWRVRKDGTRFWANVVITALYDKNGVHRGFGKVTRDLTRRKQREDMLSDTNKELQSSYKEMKKLNELKDEFVSLASHQLRTPATGVKQYLALLIDGYMGPVSELQKDALLKAYESNERQIDIVNDLLQVAQLDAGKVKLKKTVTNIGDLVEDVIDEQIDTFKNRRQTITLEIPKEPVYLKIDSVRFRMVMENLIDNASKYSLEKGEITVCISPGKDSCEIAVKDTGVGIKKTDIKKLFEKFTRLSNPLTRNISGSGLGLYWVDKIVRLHGGTITVTSSPDVGTTFLINLPMEHANA